jgi:hypothetical protein
MASSVEATFWQAVNNATGVRQVAYASAFSTYAFNPANLATYKAALVTADVAYNTAVNTAATTATTVTPFVADDGQPISQSVSATITS